MSEGPVFKRTAKDSVFTHMFQNRSYVLELYYALHPEAQDVTEDMIDIVTLENIMVNNIYNDLGFTVGDRLVILAEAQSTWSVNILIRALLYLAQTYHDYIEERKLNVYGSRRIDIPKPEIYVIYTGERKIEKDVYSLSEVFFGGEETDLDLKVHVLTDGRDGDIIRQYIMLTKVLNELAGLHGSTRKAVAETIRICKERNILKKYISEHETEVNDIMVTLFDERQIMEAYDREVREEGIRQGIQQGIRQGIQQGQTEGKEQQAKNTAYRLREKGMPTADIAEIVDASVATVQEWLSESRMNPVN